MKLATISLVDRCLGSQLLRQLGCLWPAWCHSNELGSAWEDQVQKKTGGRRGGDPHQDEFSIGDLPPLSRGCSEKLYLCGPVRNVGVHTFMPMFWKRIVWFASFCAALVSALWMRSEGYNAPLTLSVGTAIQIALPFVVFKLCAAVGIGRVNR